VGDERVRQITWADQDVRECLTAVRGTKPFVYGLTNYVAANLSANVLLAVGAAPAIGAAPGWPKAFAAAAGAIWINGAETLLEAARSAHEASTPWVLDPVAIGAGAAPYDAVIRELLQFRPTVIRGNASELIALAGGGAGAKGVESTAGSESAISFVQDLARSANTIVAVSGEIDYVTDGDALFAIPGGDVRLTQVTGAGCSLGALIAAVLAVTRDKLLATCAAHAFYATAAERAGAHTRGTGSFATALVDELSLLRADS
jgi:hydroxyethylthiazole kinase